MSGNSGSCTAPLGHDHFILSLLEPISGIQLTPEHASHYDEIASATSMKWVSELRLMDLSLKQEQAPLRRLLTSPNFLGLKKFHISLDMYSPALEGTVLAQIAKSPALAQLTELRVHCDVADKNFGDFFRVIGNSSYMSQLSTLKLGHDWLTPISETPLIHRLTDIEIPFGCACGMGKNRQRIEPLAKRLRDAFRQDQLRRLTIRGGDEMPASDRQELIDWFGDEIIDFAPGKWSEYRQFGTNWVSAQKTLIE